MKNCRITVICGIFPDCAITVIHYRKTQICSDMFAVRTIRAYRHRIINLASFGSPCRWQ